MTFNTTRQVSFNGKSCPLFPDNWWGNTDVSTYPFDQGNAAYIQDFASTGLAFTGATWANGVATVTMASTSGASNGGTYAISGAISSACTNGGDCGFNSNAGTLSGALGTQAGAYYSVTVASPTTLTFALPVNPGTWTSGGQVWTTNIRFKQIPSMALNFASNATPTLTPANSMWDVNGLESDAGPYPWLPTFAVEGYSNTGAGYVPHVVTAPDPGGDNHVLTINTDNCTYYETFALVGGDGSAGNPWHNGNGAIWNLRSNDLRTAHKLMPPAAVDSTGLTGVNVADTPIWPTVLQYAEVVGTVPISHALMVTLNIQGNGFMWPASHGRYNGAATVPLGARWVLSPTFDTVTCHMNDCAGLPWPSFMHTILVCLQHYGAMFTDGGLSIGLITDSDQRWGVTDFSQTSPSMSVQLEMWLHGLRWTNGNIIDPAIHVVGITSGALQ